MLREDQNISQERMAQLINVARQHIIRFEKATHNYSMHFPIEYCNTLGINLPALILAHADPNHHIKINKVLTIHDFSVALAYLSRHNGYDQQKIASISGLSDLTVKRIELGNSFFSIDSFNDYLSVFNLNVPLLLANRS